MEVGAPIYYISTNLIDQMYRRQFGPIEDKKITESQERAGSLSLRLGLDHLASILSGVKLEGEGKIEGKKSKSKTTSIQESVEDRTFILLKSAFHTSDISGLMTANTSNAVYTFTLPVKVTYTRVKGNKQKFIQVTHVGKDLRLDGLTSADNWVALSLLNNLLWQSTKSGELVVSGIFTPISVDHNDPIVNISAQYLLIFHPSMMRPQDDRAISKHF